MPVSHLYAHAIVEQLVGGPAAGGDAAAPSALSEGQGLGRKDHGPPAGSSVVQSAAPRRPATCTALLNDWCRSHCGAALKAQQDTRGRWACRPGRDRAALLPAGHCGALSRPRRGKPLSEEQRDLKEVQGRCRCAGGECVLLEATPKPAQMTGCLATNGSAMDPTYAAHEWPWPLRDFVIGRWMPRLSTMPLWLRLYDWIVFGPVVNLSHPQPRSVYVQVFPGPEQLQALKSRLSQLDSSHRIHALAFGGADAALSDVLRMQGSEMRRLLESRQVRRVYYEGLDTSVRSVPNLRPLPEGLADNYICPFSMQIRDAYRASPLLRRAEKVLLAAWGAWWPGNDRLPSRARALKWVRATVQQGANWLDHRQISRREWWWELRQYRFVLNPIGACVQNVRVWEALLMGVIPIGDSSSLADRQLQAEGYPMVLVRDWAMITKTRLDAWYELLLPRVGAIRPLLDARSTHHRLVHGLTVNDVLQARGDWENRIVPHILV